MRLSDVPLETRIAAARREAAEVESERERLELIAAALAPSDRIYFVPAEAQGRAAA